MSETLDASSTNNDTPVAPSPRTESPTLKPALPTSTAVAADWIQHAIRASSATQVPAPSTTAVADPFKEFDSTVVPRGESKPAPSPAMAKFQSFSMSPALRDKLVRRTFASHVLKDAPRSTSHQNLLEHSPQAAPSKGLHRSVASTKDPTASVGSIESTVSSIQSTASASTTDETLAHDQFETWYSWLLENHPYERTMAPIIQPPYQSWQVTEICGPMPHLHQCMEQICLFLDHLPKESTSQSKGPSLVHTPPKENNMQCCHSFLDIDAASEKSYVLRQLKEILYEGSGTNAENEAANAALLEGALFRTGTRDTEHLYLHFLSIYRFSMHPCQLIRTLIHAFDLDHVELEATTRAVVQKNIEKCMHVWLRSFFDDFEICPCALRTFRSFLRDLEAKVKHQTAEYHPYHRLFCKLESLLDAKTKSDSALIQRLLQGARVLKPQVQIDTEDPAALIPFLHQGSMSHVFHVSVPIMDALIRNLELPHYRILSSIKAYFQYTTHIYTWALARIEACSSTKKRSSIVKHFLKACYELRCQKDFNACFALLSALTHPWILYQKSIWTSFKKKYIAMLQELLNMADPKGNYENYFRELELPNENQDMAIPFLVLHLQLCTLLYKRPDTQEVVHQWLRYLGPLGTYRWALQEDFRTGKLSSPEPFPPTALPKFNGPHAFKRDVKLDKLRKKTGSTPEPGGSFVRSLSFQLLSSKHKPTPSQ